MNGAKPYSLKILRRRFHSVFHRVHSVSSTASSSSVTGAAPVRKLASRSSRSSICRSKMLTFYSSAQPRTRSARYQPVATSTLHRTYLLLVIDDPVSEVIVRWSAAYHRQF